MSQLTDSSKVETPAEQAQQVTEPIQATVSSPPPPQQEPELQPQPQQDIDGTLKGLYIQIIALQHNQIQQLKNQS